MGALLVAGTSSDAGKSVLVQQFMWGCLNTHKRITLYTTENTTVT